MITLNERDRPVPVIAIVDDEELVRTSMGSLMRSMGYQAALFPGGAELLCDDLDSYTCVISDVQMPGMSGLELQVRLAAREPSLPVIFITAYPDSRLKDTALAAGAYAFLEKPCDVDQITGLVQSIVDKRDNLRTSSKDMPV
jgi:FixJ family two-component response regulator